MKGRKPKSDVALEELRDCFRTPPKKVKKCVRCGADISGTNRKYCKDCREQAYQDLQLARCQEVIVTCKRCGVHFTAIDNGKGYVRTLCDDCRWEPLREKNRANKAPKKKPRVSQIESINEAARKAKMSYGKYVAMMAMKKGNRKQ